METLWFSLLPEELLIEISMYLGIDDIKKSNLGIVNSKNLWIKKLKNDNMGRYVKFLGLFREINYPKDSRDDNFYIDDYIRFQIANDEVPLMIALLNSIILIPYSKNVNEVVRKLLSTDNSVIDAVKFFNINRVTEDEDKIEIDRMEIASTNGKHYIKYSGHTEYLHFDKFKDFLIMIALSIAY